MKSIFQSKFVIGFAVIAALYCGYKGHKFLKTHQKQSQEMIVDNGSSTSTPSGNFDGLTDDQVDKLLDAGIVVVLGSGGVAARVKGSKDIYTPKNLPGADKPEQVIMAEDNHIDII
jgi:hypothetical protein